MNSFKNNWKSFPVIARIAFVTIYVPFYISFFAPNWLGREYRTATWLILIVCFTIVCVAAYRKYMDE